MKKIKAEAVLLSLVVLTAFMTGGCHVSKDSVKDENQSEEETSRAEAVADEFQVREELVEMGEVREPKVSLKGDGSDTTTILVYMNGSDLESNNESASEDLQEMIDAGGSDQVKVIVQTMGTKKWKPETGIASDHSQIYELDGEGLHLVKDDLGQLDCTRSETLGDFIEWGEDNYPADRYELILWDHGGGPIYGFGYDEWQEDTESLTVDEIQAGLEDAGVYFDFIGMDCCLMSCLEIGLACYDYCDYMILSEDFESSIGWDYTGWLKALYENPSLSAKELGTMICWDSIQADMDEGEDGNILALVNTGAIPLLFKTWKAFAYANEESLLEKNFSRRLVDEEGERLLPRLKEKSLSGQEETDSSSEGSGESDTYDMADYYVTDILAVSESLDTEESKALSSAVAQTLIYVDSTEGDDYLSGISVTLPYGDLDFYEEMAEIFENMGIDEEYIDFLCDFVYADWDNYYDYSEWDEEWNGFEDYEDDYDWGTWQEAV